MINIQVLEIVLFDFDDTLCIHSRTSHADKEMYNKELVKEAGADWWDRICSKDSSHMLLFMKILYERGISMGLLSQTSSFVNALRKNEWVKKHYGYNLENFSVMDGDIKSKIEMMVAISDAYQIPRGRILIVDDKESILNMAISYGFQAASPMEIVNYIENEKRIWRKQHV